MTSYKQFEANRRNALKSTGPRTSEGKERSRRNAVRHGLTAETVIGLLEDADDYEAFQAAVIADYDAETAVERELVLRLASVLWRLRRATGIESGLFEAVSENPRLCKSASLSEQFLRVADPPEHDGRYLIDQKSVSVQKQSDFDFERRITDAFLRLAALPTCPLDRLSRYEHVLWRQTRQIILSLKFLRRRRWRQSTSPSRFALRD